MRAAHEMPGADLAELRLFDRAQVTAGVRTTRPEAAGCRRIEQIRWAAGDRSQPAFANALTFELRQRAE
jgi:hypothetical protein